MELPGAVLNARKLAAPIAAGCHVIVKGAEETPSDGTSIAEALERRQGVPSAL
ncbi:aldehyde dehydrogenase family protein [Bradyrhizobium canariense]|uniref:aldehyde dehydrogenase family protein n=1 Tax=Bradyrhizobium canariense TaxID=255045 RepID=UPI0028A14855|nr:aldehyde dehydrogenase family protein [Bradyrhizobium canariense]